MRLLVSVRSGVEAAAALAGGADIIDAKEPAAGALGAVAADVLREIVATVAGRRMVTAALGDARDERSIVQAAAEAAASGATLIKIGFAGIESPARACQLLAAAIDGACGAGTVAVAYADHDAAGALPPEAVVEVAVGAGAVGLLIDTVDKQGPGLRRLVDLPTLNRWVDAAHTGGLLVAVAGQVVADDLAWLAKLGIDVVGIRGAVCEGGRNGMVTADRVQVIARTLGAADLGQVSNAVEPSDLDRVTLPGRTRVAPT